MKGETRNAITKKTNDVPLFPLLRNPLLAHDPVELLAMLILEMLQPEIGDIPRRCVRRSLDAGGKLVIGPLNLEGKLPVFMMTGGGNDEAGGGSGRH